MEVTIGSKIIPKVNKFKYLSSMIQDISEIDEDVSHCIKIGWLKWRIVSRVTYDKKMQLRIKCKLYNKHLPTTPPSIAQTWFKTLLNGSITCYDVLRYYFLAHFNTKKQMPRSTMELFGYVQDKIETLRSYGDKAFKNNLPSKISM